MPRYFFDLDDHGFEPDEAGEELPGADAARAHAVIYAGSLLRDEPNLVLDGRAMSINVRNEMGEAVARVHIRIEDALAT